VFGNIIVGFEYPNLDEDCKLVSHPITHVPVRNYLKRNKTHKSKINSSVTTYPVGSSRTSRIK